MSPVNSQFFGSYNVDSVATNSATNYNGQTKVLDASSTVTPNVNYHLKIVIADRNDFQNDSAIFIEAGKLNIGQNVLGKDLSMQNNTALCQGQS